MSRCVNYNYSMQTFKITIVNRVADDIRRGGFIVTNDLLDSSVDNIIKMSGMWDEDGDLDRMQTQQFGRRPYRRGKRGFHNRNTLRDLTRILLIRELIR